MHRIVFVNTGPESLKLWCSTTVKTRWIKKWASRQREGGLEFDYRKLRGGRYEVTYIGPAGTWTRNEFRAYATLIQQTHLSHEQEAILQELQGKIERVEEAERRWTRFAV